MAYSTETVERLLKALSADEITSLTRRLEASHLQQRTLSKPKKGIALAVPQPSWQQPVSREIVAKNNKRLQALSPTAPGVEIFRPDLKDKNPVDIIKQLTCELKEHPTVQKSQFLQHTINSYTSVNNVTHELKKEIEKSLSVRRGIKTLDDIWYTAYVDANYGGASVTYFLTPGWVYYDLSWVGSAINDAISSLKLYTTSDEVAGGYVIIFQNINFQGNYEIFPITTNRDLDVTEIDYGFVGSTMNDQTSSILTVRRFENENAPWQPSELISTGDIINITNDLANVSSTRNPTWSWDLWPSGGGDAVNDPTKMFITLTIPFTWDTGDIDGSNDCQILYWIYLYLNNEGYIEGYVAYWQTTVWSNLAFWNTNNVLNDLSNEVPKTFGPLNSLIASMVNSPNNQGPFDLLYYLPGNANGVYPNTGNTNDGVTVITRKA